MVNDTIWRSKADHFPSMQESYITCETVTDTTDASPTIAGSLRVQAYRLHLKRGLWLMIATTSGS